MEKYRIMAVSTPWSYVSYYVQMKKKIIFISYWDYVAEFPSICMAEGFIKNNLKEH